MHVFRHQLVSFLQLPLMFFPIIVQRLCKNEIVIVRRGSFRDKRNRRKSKDVDTIEADTFPPDANLSVRRNDTARLFREGCYDETNHVVLVRWTKVKPGAHAMRNCKFDQRLRIQVLNLDIVVVMLKDTHSSRLSGLQRPLLHEYGSIAKWTKYSMTSKDGLDWVKE